MECMRVHHLPEERIASLNQDPEHGRLEWRRKCFNVDPNKKKELETTSDKDKVEGSSEKQTTILKDSTSSKPKDSGLSEMHPLGFGSKRITTPSPETRDLK